MNRAPEPNAKTYNASPDYIRALVDKAQQRHSISRREVARRCGIGWTTLCDWQAGRSVWSYPAQYTLERLAAE